MVTVLIEGPLEVRLKRAATSAGAAPEALAERLLEEGLGDLPPVSPPEDHLSAGDRAFFDAVRAEGDAATPEQLAEWAREGEELMQNLDRARRESNGPNYRPIWPMADHPTEHP